MPFNVHLPSATAASYLVCLVRNFRSKWPGGKKYVRSGAWLAFLFTLMCGAAGLYAARISISHISNSQDASTWLVPLVAGSATVVLSVLVIVFEFSPSEDLSVLGKGSLAIGVMLAYGLLLRPLGFLLSSVLFVFGIAAIYAPRKIAIYVEGIIVVVIMWALFRFALSEVLPQGIWLKGVLWQ